MSISRMSAAITYLQAAINSMNPYGRIAACGMISGYNAATPEPGPNNLMLIVGKKIRITGFIVSDHVDMREAFLSEMIPGFKQAKSRAKKPLSMVSTTL